MNFIEITDNTGDSYYVNPSSIAYLKETPPQHSQSSRAVYKVVLKNDKQILISLSDFSRIRQGIYGEEIV
jgi:hypothetical protein